jgi:hypothetical protein
MAISASMIAAAALLWPAPASAFHDLPCGAFSETIVDKDTGRERCVELAPEVLEVLQRTRQLQLQQEQRTRALAQQQRPPDSGRRVRALAIEQQQIEQQQTQIESVERAKQRQLSRELNVQTAQPALSLEQSVTRQRSRSRVEPDETRRRALLRANELERRQNVLKQQVTLPTVGLESELRARRRQLEKQGSRP